MDYDPIIEIVTFLPEEITKSVYISIKDDTNVEFDESFFLYLVSGEGVHLSPFSRAEVVIRNDDGKNCYVMVNVRAARLYPSRFQYRTRAEPESGKCKRPREYPVRAETPYVNHFVVRHSPVPGLRKRSGPLRG